MDLGYRCQIHIETVHRGMTISTKKVVATLNLANL